MEQKEKQKENNITDEIKNCSQKNSNKKILNSKLKETPETTQEPNFNNNKEILKKVRHLHETIKIKVEQCQGDLIKIKKKLYENYDIKIYWDDYIPGAFIINSQIPLLNGLIFDLKGKLLCNTYQPLYNINTSDILKQLEYANNIDKNKQVERIDNGSSLISNVSKSIKSELKFCYEFVDKILLTDKQNKCDETKLKDNSNTLIEENYQRDTSGKRDQCNQSDRGNQGNQGNQGNRGNQGNQGDIGDQEDQNNISYDQLLMEDWNNMVFEDLNDGVTIRIFWRGNKWNFSTNKLINAYKSHWFSIKDSIGTMFEKYIEDNKTFYKRLDKTKSYIFSIISKSTSLVGLSLLINSKLEKPIIIYIATFDNYGNEIEDDKFNDVPYFTNSLTDEQIKNSNYIFKPQTRKFTDIMELLKTLNGTSEELFLGYIAKIKIENPKKELGRIFKRLKIENPLFTYLKKLFGNTKNLCLRYSELLIGREQTFEKYFPDMAKHIGDSHNKTN
jgi:hypothetical protein